jgi:hypothetical protein
MKKVSVPVTVLRVALYALLIAAANHSVKARETDSSNASGAIFATSPSHGGRLIVNRSPTLGHNIGVTLTIDGQLAGSITRGRTFDRYITPGRHTLGASPGRGRTPWHGTLNVRAGETYTYTASYHVNKLELTPVSR